MAWWGHPSSPHTQGHWLSLLYGSVGGLTWFSWDFFKYFNQICAPRPSFGNITVGTFIQNAFFRTFFIFFLCLTAQGRNGGGVSSSAISVELLGDLLCWMEMDTAEQRTRGGFEGDRETAAHSYIWQTVKETQPASGNFLNRFTREVSKETFFFFALIRIFI